MAERSDVTVQIKGLKEISDSLKGLPRELAQKVLDQSTRKQVTIWRDVAAARAPQSVIISVKTAKKTTVDKKGRLFAKQQFIHTPGTLKRSIKVKKLKSAAEGSVNSQESRFGIKILGKAFYWKFVEFGSVHNRPPTSFLRNTFNALAELSLRAIAEDCAKGIEKYFRSMNKGTPK